MNILFSSELKEMHTKEFIAHKTFRIVLPHTGCMKYLDDSCKENLEICVTGTEADSCFICLLT
jgi:hypothetical protein